MTVLLELRKLAKLRLLQLLALALLLGGLAGLSLAAKAPVLDADVWWHLKVGDWIVEHHAFPRVGLFSRTAAARPWMAYSWGYEVLLSRAYAWFGLMGVALFGILLTAAVAAALFWMAHRLSGKFWVAWGLCAAASLACLFNVLPRPVFFSMIFFAATLALILEANRSSNVRPLYWLPLVFMLWANFHIQFIYGLFGVGLFVAANLLQPIAAHFKIGPLHAPAFPAKPLLAIFTACVLACCIGPYSYHLFEVVLQYSRSKFPYIVLQEAAPLDFRHPSDYILALLAAAAVVVVIRRRELVVFKTVLLAVAGVFAIRHLRDAWFLAIPAAAFLADLPAPDRAGRRAMKWHELVAVAAVLALVLFLVARNTGFNARGLDAAISRQYPVDAVNFLRRYPAPGPLYNDFGWGGFLIWYMPNYPVAIDGRTDLYGDEIELMTFRSISGDYGSDPYLKEAGLLLLPNETPLARLLVADPQFRVLYSDRLATVFVRNQKLQPE